MGVIISDYGCIRCGTGVRRFRPEGYLARASVCIECEARARDAVQPVQHQRATHASWGETATLAAPPRFHALLTWIPAAWRALLPELEPEPKGYRPERGPANPRPPPGAGPAMRRPHPLPPPDPELQSWITR